MSNHPKDDTTDALLKNLQERSASQNTPVEEDTSPAEDIDAFLADLEGGDETPAASAATPPPAAAEPDPFADAFAALEDVHGEDVEQELAAKYAVQTSDPLSVKTVDASPASPSPRPVAPPSTPAVETIDAQEQDKNEEVKPVEEKAAKKDKKKKKKDKPLVPVVETQRSRGFLLAMALIKWSLILTPVITAIWLAGALLANMLSTGWMILLATLLPAILLPLVLKLLLRRGRWWHFALPLSLLFLGGVLFLIPQASGKASAYYGHWPSSTVSQLAEVQPDNAVVRSHAFVTEALGEQLLILDPAAQTTPAATDSKEPLLARALGTDTELVTWAESQRQAALEAIAKEAPPEKTDEAKESEPAETTSPKAPAEEKEQEAPAKDASK